MKINYKGYNILITDNPELGLDCAILPSENSIVSLGKTNFHIYKTEEEKHELIKQLIQEAKVEIDAILRISKDI